MAIPKEARISIVVPTLNEGKAIGRVVERIRECVGNGEVIVVDSSDDDTYAEALNKGAMAIKEPRQGYGHAIKRGLSMASGDVLLFIDGDDSYDPSDIPKVIGPILRNEADVSVGTRFHSKPEGMTILRYVGNLFINFIFSTLFRKRVTDSQTGLKAMSREAYERLDLEEDGMTLSTEVLLKSLIQKLRVREVQVSYRTRVGSSKLSPARDGAKILFYMCRERFA
jgi:glycosyltransferase involved in cell wall biosynthesis